MIVTNRRGNRGVVVQETKRLSNGPQDRPFDEAVRCRIREDRDGRGFNIVVVINHLGFQSAGSLASWPKNEADRARLLALLAIGEALDDETDLGGDGHEPATLDLRTDAYDKLPTPAASNQEIREYVLLKAAWSDRLGERGCRFERHDAWRLGVRIELIHNAEQLLIDEGLLTREGPLLRPTLKLIERFDGGRIGHAPPLLQAISKRLNAPRYEAAYEQVLKALAAFSAEDQDLAEAATSAVRAVESLACVVSRRPDDTLGDIANGLRAEGKLRPPLHKIFDAIYGFRSSRPGLGHGGVIPTDTELREAILVYNAAAACIEFLLELDRPDDEPRKG